MELTANKNKTGRDRILSKVKEILCNYFKNYSVNIYLFGSWAKGAEKRTSDIDVGIVFLEEVPEGYLSQALEELEQSNIPYRVELIDMTNMSEEKRKNFLEGAIIWKDCSKG